MRFQRWKTLSSAATLLTLAAAILAGGAWLFFSPSPAAAQCGTQMSSCRNCHEVKGQLKVNTKGDWHVQHAFGDFCVACHAGDAKAKDEAAAHTSMIKPLDNMSAACLSCHPTDTQARGDKYAKILGVTAGMGSAAQPTPAPAAAAVESAPPGASGTSGGTGGSEGGAPGTSPGSSAPSASVAGPIGGVAVGDVIDFNAPVETAAPVNIGNLILVALILLIGAAWAALALRSWIGAARTRVAHTAREPRPLAVSPSVQALVPILAACDEETLHALDSLLKRDDVGQRMLVAVSRLSPEWLDVVAKADLSDVALAMALTGKL